jgi:branched-chain amino acid aminotransferase
MKNMTIFLDGQYKKISENRLKGISPGLLKGLGVFETLLCEDNKVFFLPEHYRRFLHGCDRYILPKPPALKEIRTVVSRLLLDNKIKNGRIRLAAWRRGWELHFAVVIVDRVGFSDSIYRRGFRVGVYPRRLDRPFQLAKIKSLDYHFFLRAYEHALKNHCQEVVLLNTSGHVVEGSRSNIFCVKGRKLLTPSLASGCLAGVTRQMVLNAAKNLGIKTAVKVVTVEDLRNSEEIFLTNALVGLMPVTWFEDSKIAKGQPGPVTNLLSKSYGKLSQTHRTFLV